MKKHRVFSLLLLTLVICSALLALYFKFSSNKGEVLGATTGPIISNIQITNVSTTSAVVTWNTDVPASTQLLMLDTLHNPIRRYPEPKDSSLTPSHLVSLNNLVPNTKYAFNVASINSAGGMTSSAGDNTFTTLPINASSTPDFRVDTLGSKNVYAGSDLYFGFKVITLSGTLSHYYYPVYSITGLPTSISAHVLCTYNTNPGNESADHYAKESCWGQKGSVRLRVSSDTPPGRYTANITFRANTLDRPYTYTFNVLPAPAPISKNTVSPIPPIPGLEKWESNMISVGQKWCNGKTYSMGYEGDVWYYDGGRVYMQIADYTKDPATWMPCAENVLNQYRKWVNDASGNIQGWRKFPAGLAMHYWRYGDDPSRQAVVNLYNSVTGPYINAAAPIWGQLTDPYVMRELAYAINGMVFGEQIGQPRSLRLAVAVDGALAQYDQLFVSDPWQFNQPFFDGLMAEALINYYGVTKDPRIPPAIKQMLDWLWENSVNKQTGQIAYNHLKVPPYYITDLNNLIIPPYAWYWNISGDDTYRQRGDFLFEHALDTPITYSGKIFSENYHWSFDYVKWRKGGAETSASSKEANLISATPQVEEKNEEVVVIEERPQEVITEEKTQNETAGAPAQSSINNGTGSASGSSGSSSGSSSGRTSTGALISGEIYGYSFNKNLSSGSEGQDVRELQKFLVSQSFLTADNITGYFGPMTEEAVKKFQKYHNIVTFGTPQTTGYGNLGSVTRAKINSMTGASPTLTTAQVASIKLQIQELLKLVGILMQKLADISRR